MKFIIIFNIEFHTKCMCCEFKASANGHLVPRKWLRTIYLECSLQQMISNIVGFDTSFVFDNNHMQFNNSLKYEQCNCI